MIGGYDIYAAVSNNNHQDQQLVDLANQLRLKIQDVVMNVSVNYITDSITLPVNVPQHFLKDLVPAFSTAFSLPGNTDQERAEAAAQLVATRVQRGGHFANTYPEQIQRSRESALQLRKEVQEHNVNVRAFHYNSSNGNYVEFELKEGAR
ncbi:Slc38a1 [Symbiodinium sp. CCMP2592]|nr:Slc38a1 [Symbiodinium sp. CCMP2592]